MKLMMLMAMAAAGSFTQAMPGFDREPALVPVYVRISFGDRQLKLQRAEGIASEIFAQAGVQIRWRTGWSKASQEKHPILIEISSDTPEMVCQGALGCATVYEGVHIKIFWDRIQRMTGRDRAHELLGHVLTHEITHILEGINRHSPEGVMKAHWTAHDLLEMEHTPLAFDPEDVKLIHDGLAQSCVAGEAAHSKACASSKAQLVDKENAVISPIEIAGSKR